MSTASDHRARVLSGLYGEFPEQTASVEYRFPIVVYDHKIENKRDDPRNAPMAISDMIFRFHKGFNGQGMME